MSWPLTALIFFLGLAVLTGIGLALTTLISDGHFPRWHRNPYDQSPGVDKEAVQPLIQDEPIEEQSRR